MRSAPALGVLLASALVAACDGDLGETTTASGAGPVGAGGMAQGGATGGDIYTWMLGFRKAL